MSVKLLNLAALRGVEDIQDLAKRAGVSVWTLRVIEAGGVVRRHEADRIVEALGTDLATAGALEMQDA